MKRLLYKELLNWKTAQKRTILSKSDAEVDFIIQLHNEIYPLEVKSGLNRNKKSLKSYQTKYNPKLILRTSPRNLTKDDDFINIPLYMLFNIDNLI